MVYNEIYTTEGYYRGETPITINNEVNITNNVIKAMSQCSIRVVVLFFYRPMAKAKECAPKFWIPYPSLTEISFLTGNLRALNIVSYIGYQTTTYLSTL